MQSSTHATGPLKLPAPPDAATRRAVAERLKEHTTSPAWLPEGVFSELDAVRAEHHRLRGQVAADLEALDALSSRFRREDAEHAERLRQAHRDGSPTSAEDHRTPGDQRAAERAAIEERLWAGIHVFAEHADLVIETVREHEDDWLADLRARLVPAQDKRRQAEALLAEARAEEFRLHQLGPAGRTPTADDVGFGRQPAPVTGPVPDRVSAEVFEGALERPWHKRREWNGTAAGTGA